MSRARKICVVTGSRAEYGLLYWLMREIESDPDLELQVLVTGMHLSPTFGYTVSEIEADGMPIAARVDIQLDSDTPVGIATSVGIGVPLFAKALTELAPDIVVVLGDRFEVLAVAQASMLCRIPIAHIHGGELTEGLIDEAIRHAVTKMSHLHFTATARYRDRVIQLGENPDSVFHVGAMGLDAIHRREIMDRKQVFQSVGVPEKIETLFLVTYHPVSLDPVGSMRGIENLTAALEHFPFAGVIFTGTNADHGGRDITDTINTFVKKNPNLRRSEQSLGQRLYLNTLAHADVVIGNSSSGIIEAPVMRTPTVNIGDRQAGRMRPASVIDCSNEVGEIVSAITSAQSEQHRRVTDIGTDMYGVDSPAPKVVAVLRDSSLDGILFKQFWDLP